MYQVIDKNDTNGVIDDSREDNNYYDNTNILSFENVNLTRRLQKVQPSQL